MRSPALRVIPISDFVRCSPTMPESGWPTGLRLSSLSGLAELATIEIETVEGDLFGFNHDHESYRFGCTCVAG